MSDPTAIKPGQRIVVVGTSGCGKTYVAKALAERLGIRYISNDAIIWRPNWVETPREFGSPLGAPCVSI